MTPSRAAPFAVLVLLGLVGEAPAQAPGGASCMAAFAPLRNETEKRAAAIKAGVQRHALPQELCQLFTHFSESEAKVVKYMETNASQCGIPPQIVSTTKTNHAKTMETRQKVCASAVERRLPGLGDAIGARAAPTPDTATAGAGTFDTLSGNALTK